MDIFIQHIILGIVISSTPLILAAIGELLVERSGVLNLGVEGMMIIGAVVGFIVKFNTGITIIAILSAVFSAMFFAGIFAILTQYLKTNQVATGLALTLFGLGCASLFGQSYTGVTIQKIENIHIPFLSDIYIIGDLIFNYDPLTYFAILSVIFVSWFLFKTKKGLVLQAIGDNHDAAHAIGYNVVFYRIMAILFGGAMAGLGGAYLSLVQTPLWAENMTAGRGWIALALVVFSSWQPYKIIFGACLFGGITIIQLHSQAFGINISSHYMSMLPYIMTILVLVAISYHIKALKKSNNTVPKCLGKNFNISH